MLEFAWSFVDPMFTRTGSFWNSLASAWTSLGQVAVYIMVCLSGYVTYIRGALENPFIPSQQMQYTEKYL